MEGGSLGAAGMPSWADGSHVCTLLCVRQEESSLSPGSRRGYLLVVGGMASGVGNKSSAASQGELLSVIY